MVWPECYPGVTWDSLGVIVPLALGSHSCNTHLHPGYTEVVQGATNPKLHPGPGYTRVTPGSHHGYSQFTDQLHPGCTQGACSNTQVMQILHPSYTNDARRLHPSDTRATSTSHPGHMWITPGLRPGHTSSSPRRDLGVALVSTGCHPGVQKTNSKCQVPTRISGHYAFQIGVPRR